MESEENVRQETWQERLVEEFKQVSKRLDSLDYFLYCWEQDELSKPVKTPKSVFEVQLKAMKEYKMCLEARLLIEGIHF